MDNDLQDFLAAWAGAELSESRRQAILARLKADPAFRRQAADEVHLIGLLRAVQSAEPRWLELEEALGAGAQDGRAADRLEAGVMDQLPAARRPWGRWLGWGIAAAGAAAAAALWLRPGPPAAGVGPALAVVAEVRGVSWARSTGARPEAGGIVCAGRLRMAAGELALAFVHGVTIRVQAPCDVELLSRDRVLCREGRIKALVPDEARGFSVLTPDAAVVDLGTEFDVTVEREGRTEVRVHRGRVEVAALDDRGLPHDGRIVHAGQIAAIRHGSGAVAVQQDSKPAAPVEHLVPMPRLALDRGYERAVLQDDPVAFWRFFDALEGVVFSRTAGAPPLFARGGVRFETAGGGAASAVFEGEGPAFLAMGEEWAPSGGDFAVELWVASRRVTAATLAGLVTRPSPDVPYLHSVILEFPVDALPERTLGRLRFLLRSPPGTAGGLSAFSPDLMLPYRWYHVVAQRAGGRMELYVDGRLAASRALEGREEVPPSALLLGKLDPGNDTTRQFSGCLAEVAIYARALPEDVIRRHADMGRSEAGGRR